MLVGRGLCYLREAAATYIGFIYRLQFSADTPPLLSVFRGFGTFRNNHFAWKNTEHCYYWAVRI